MGKIKTIEVSIGSLKFEYEDPWLGKYADEVSPYMDFHPLALALKGNINPLRAWCAWRRDMKIDTKLNELMNLYKSLIINGQLEPIVITRDNVIVTGHKRCSCFLAMGKDKINARYEKI